MDTTVLCFGDIYARPGRKAVSLALPKLKEKYQPDFILANVENIAGGYGVNKKTLAEMFQMGFHGFTSGNHIWDNKEVLEIFESEHRLVRPANYPSPPGMPCPGNGCVTLENNGKKLFIINLMGRVHMGDIECPFQMANQMLSDLREDLPIFVDFHAEATSEMTAMGWHLNGRVAAVVGTHTHVQTADEFVLPGGTAYITDIGLSGSFHSVIGVEPDIVLSRFLTKRPKRLEPAQNNLGVGAVVIKIGPDNKAKSIERLRFSVE